MIQITETIKLFKNRQGEYGMCDPNNYVKTWATANEIADELKLSDENKAKLNNAMKALYDAKRKNETLSQSSIDLLTSFHDTYGRAKRIELLDNYEENESASTTENSTETKQVSETPINEVLDNCIKFFKEFDFLPNFRFVSMISELAKKNVNKVKEYVNNYFELSDKMATIELNEKMKSWEFENMCEELAKHECKTQNHRLKIFYGPQGTGKTTLASKETKDIIVCHSGMLPADLMEDFEFDDGKAGFHKSLLWKAMENGTPVILDEINLLQLDSLRFLQGLLDEKNVINYKGQEIHIKDGFYIIGTMNLQVNGCTYALPEPLVDRCSEIKKFDITGKQLAMMFN